MGNKFTLRGARGTRSREPDVSGQVDFHDVIHGVQHPGQIHEVPGESSFEKAESKSSEGAISQWQLH